VLGRSYLSRTIGFAFPPPGKMADVPWTLQNPDVVRAAVGSTMMTEPLLKTQSAHEACLEVIAAKSKVKKAVNQPSIAVRIT
jgi:hypothetical protein